MSQLLVTSDFNIAGREDCKVQKNDIAGGYSVKRRDFVLF